MSELVVYGLPGPAPLCSASPYVLKLCTWLREAQIPYRYEIPSGPPGSPSGKVPYVRLPDGTLLEDSHVIIEHLARSHGVPGPVDPAQHPSAHAALRLVEDSLYWTLIWERWCTDAGFAVVKADYFTHMPAWVRPVVAAMVRRQARGLAKAQGISRMPESLVLARARADLLALAGLLGDQARFVPGPNEVDASVFSTLVQLLVQPPECAGATLLDPHPILRAYHDRIQADCWG